MLAPGSTPHITLVTPGNDRPPAGTYPIVVFAQGGSASDVCFIASFVAQIGTGSYTSTSGTWTIQSSTDARVVGSFSFEAQRGTVGDPQNVTVQGSFNAVNPATGGA